ncbi:uncharacterized protein Z520_08973 [Fonsecaea multimorphosa CBS 102226]|uniref:C2H2-type domain-containing protein n=1 Tax=Fonsecaea multimorphosa CBS 102226 TaxID=1442371 RepID=A0A0D2IEE6_9EURO|nr:uncharacterized protein Z520_08973 [Fonsecaea multimorphosa CBS 102226]KIX95456.1 hypothetical protein Z520_08973 [Fonsecaea multimorphosa CBS 102226]OAL20988.1 hypothetical protein AYO22_08408 [Fonsecaea multimorphosa]
MAPRNAKRFPCPKVGCTKSFVRKMALQSHLDGRQHANLRRFQCPECPTRFVRKDDRRKHRERKHQQLARFSCGASSCSAAYATRHELNRHLRRFPEHIQDEGNPSASFQEVTALAAPNENPHQQEVDQQEIDQRYEEQWQLLVGCGSWAEFPAVLEDERVQDEETGGGRLVAELSLTILENDPFLLSEHELHSPSDDALMQSSRSTLLDCAGEPREVELQNRWSRIREFLQAFNSAWDETYESITSPSWVSYARPLGSMMALDMPFVGTGSFVERDLPFAAEPNPAALADNQAVLDQLVKFVRSSWYQYDFSNLEVDLRQLYAKLANGFRRFREHGVGVLEQHVKKLLQQAFKEELARRNEIERDILFDLNQEIRDFCAARDTGTSFDKLAKEFPHADIWESLADISDEQELRVKYQMETRFLVQQKQRELSHAYSGANLTLEWLEEAIRCALLARQFCKSIISGHTDSTIETVRTASQRAVESVIATASHVQEECEMDLDVRD